MDLSVVVLTFNEEANLPRLLDTVETLGCAVFLVDSGSTDATEAVAAKHGARVLRNDFATHSTQWAWALANLPLRTEWVLALDADQSLTTELAEELQHLFSTEPGLQRLSEFDGFFVKRRQVFRGRWIRHGGYYPKYLLKLFRRDKVSLDAGDLMDHHFSVSGRVGKLRFDLIEENKKEDDIGFWVDKHNRYATLIAREELLRGRGPLLPELKAWLFGSPDERVSGLKGLWRRLPLYVRPFLYFLYRYFLRFGWMDGKQGFVFHFLQAFWFRFLVDVKLEEIRWQERADGRPT